MLKRIACTLAVMLVATAAEARIPTLNATCAQGVEVHADQGGPVYINGKQAKLKTFNQNYYEARLGKVTISIAINPDGSAIVSATWRGGGNGICRVR